jgi:hypothetical protein
MIGYHASHEQFIPSELLNLVHLAEASGFIMTRGGQIFLRALYLPIFDR